MTMRTLYVIAEQGTGKLYTGSKIVRDRYTGWKMSDWMVGYPSKKKPVFFTSKEKAKETLDTLNRYFYIRRARGKELKWTTPEHLPLPKNKSTDAM